MGTLVECIAACDIYDMVLDPAFHQITSGGGWVKIEWDRGSGVRGIDLERELKRKRIPICGRGFTMRSETETGALGRVRASEKVGSTTAYNV